MKKNTVSFLVRKWVEVGLTAGLDVGDEYSHLALLDGSRELVEESREILDRAAGEIESV